MIPIMICVGYEEDISGGSTMREGTITYMDVQIRMELDWMVMIVT